jgi:hypothetical protein
MGRVSERKAEGPREQPSRYSRTTNGLLASLLVTVLAVGAFVALRGAFRDQPDVTREPVDYLGTVEALQKEGVEIVYPVRLPTGWIATSIDFVPGAEPAWGIGMLTDDARYVGLRQEDADADELVSVYVDEDAEPGDEGGFESGLATGAWQTWSDAGGDLAYSTTLTSGATSTMGETVLVYGSAGRDDQEQLIALLTTDGVG